MSGAPPRTRGPGRPAGAHGQEGKQALLDATRELIAEKGLPRVTLREIARRAGVRPALVSYYFEGKAGLLEAVIERVAGEARRRIAAAAVQGDTAQERLASMVRSLIRGIGADPYAPRLLLEMVFFADDRLTDRFARDFGRPNLETIGSLLAEGHAEGDLRDVDLRFFMPCMMGLCIFFFLAAPLLRRLFGIGRLDEALIDAFADFAAELLLSGVAVPQGSTP